MNLKSLGYTVRFQANRKYWTVIPKGWEKPIRLARLGEEYTNGKDTCKTFRRKASDTDGAFSEKKRETEAVSSDDTKRQAQESSGRQLKALYSDTAMSSDIFQSTGNDGAESTIF